MDTQISHSERPKLISIQVNIVSAVEVKRCHSDIIYEANVFKTQGCANEQYNSPCAWGYCPILAHLAIEAWISVQIKKSTLWKTAARPQHYYTTRIYLLTGLTEHTGCEQHFTFHCPHVDGTRTGILIRPLQSVGRGPTSTCASRLYLWSPSVLHGSETWSFTHYRKNTDWGCFRTKCWKYLDLWRRQQKHIQRGDSYFVSSTEYYKNRHIKKNEMAGKSQACERSEMHIK